MRSDLKQLIGLRVKAIRQSKGLTQEAIASLMTTASQGFSTESVSNIERGRTLPGLDTLQRLANALNTTLTELVEPIESHSVDDPERVTLAAELNELGRRLTTERLKIAVAQVRLLNADDTS